jgi:hypothetical protein
MSKTLSCVEKSFAVIIVESKLNNGQKSYSNINVKGVEKISKWTQTDYVVNKQLDKSCQISWPDFRVKNFR